MKMLILLLLILMPSGLFAQKINEETFTPQRTIELFFEAMNRQDTTSMRALTFGNVTLKSIGESKTNDAEISTEVFDEFLKAIADLPEELTIQEKIHSYEIEVDGRMAHVWTPYSFYVNGNLIHCGANSFQLFKNNDEWKIISILDTRRKNCTKKD